MAQIGIISGITTNATNFLQGGITSFIGSAMDSTGFGGAIDSAIGGLGLGDTAFGNILGLDNLGSKLSNRLTTSLTGAINDKLFGGGGAKKHSYGRQLKNLQVQSSTYGEVIPTVYGTSRIAGNIIWARPIKETAHTTSAGGGGVLGKGGPSGGGDRTDFSYSATLAIALCEGEIDDVTRVWADAKAIDPAQLGISYTLYKGSEDQAVDPTIESFQGVGSTPAYRGLAYVVIEDFPLAEFGNRIPNFTFEVKRKLLLSGGGEALENRITSMIMIPGSGEFVYDTVVQRKMGGQYLGDGITFVQNGGSTCINQNNVSSKADALVALDQLAETCPNLEWVGLVVTWFGNSTDAGDCILRPGVEYVTGAATKPDSWSVGLYDRAGAHAITHDADGNPVYGGTPSDACVLRYVEELRNRGYKIMLYPMFFMDTPDKPWRGRVTGSASDVETFFTNSNGYNSFIMHYANLVEDKVDAFIIGSELIGLTKIKDVINNYPAVTQLVGLAATVKGILGSGVKVGYAADWSEYHHTDGGWYNLDPLWASSNIDFIGIDAYFPLTDAPQTRYDRQEATDGWTSGEGWDFYYTDEARTSTAPLIPAYAWKNIAWWWSHTHTNPGGATTAWTPASKPIWFTEFGFPSVDGSTNQPNVFYDPSSSESYFPRHSRGTVDFRAQRLGLEATFDQWEGSGMVENMFIWTWDARPYPFWPQLSDVWKDSGLWRTGHWVNGKLGISGLASIVADICRRAGLPEERFDVSSLTELVDGYVLDKRQDARAALTLLARAYFFDCVESDGVLKFVPRGQEPVLELSENELVPLKDNPRELVQITRAQELDLPRKVDITYISRSFEYQVGSQYAERTSVATEDVATLSLPIVMGDVQARQIANTALYNTWMERTSYRLRLPAAYAALEPTDVIEVTEGEFTHRIRITRTSVQEGGMLDIAGVAEDSAVYRQHTDNEDTAVVPGVVTAVGDTALELLDLPLLPDSEELQLHVAMAGEASLWRGAILYRSNDGGTSYRQVVSASAATMGSATEALGEASPCLWDEANRVEVVLLNGELESVTELAVLNGANAALLGEEIIQFRNATLTAPGVYSLSGLLRGRLGTESAIAIHEAGERFVLLDARLSRMGMPIGMLGLSRLYKPVSIGHTLAQTDAESFTWNAVSLKPYAPVHITGTRDGGGDLTIRWIRRTRTGGDWRDNADVPLGEAQEAYELDVFDGADIVRTITVNAATATYTATEQTADFGSPQSSISIRVYQLSAMVGRGRAGEATI